MLDRKTTIATKAVAQTFSHVVRAAYFGSLSGFGDLPSGPPVPAIAARDRRHLARALRDRAHDRPRLSPMDAGVIFAISSIYLARAAWLFWHAS